MSSTLTSSTKNALDNILLSTIAKQKFCIVGCGGVGAYFAEMLVRTGAINVSLVDGDIVELKNLNRTPFIKSDVGKYKTEALKVHLESINNKAIIQTKNQHFGDNNFQDKNRQLVRDLIFSSSVVLIAIDNNSDRKKCEDMLREGGSSAVFMSIGVAIDKSKNTSSYECIWKPKTVVNLEAEGYGENNGSYMSIVLEAISVGFNMMLHHLQNPKSTKFTHIYREFKNHILVAQEIKDQEA